MYDLCNLYMYPNITKVPRYLIIETINKSMAVAAQVLHPIFRRPGLPTCEAIFRPQKYPWGFNHGVS